MRAEDAFWILVGLIRLFPRPFSVSDSVLSGDCFSVMRYEFITFKALVEQNLPKLYNKLKDIGMPLEMLIYKPILNMYTTYFVQISFLDFGILYFSHLVV